MVGFLTFQDVPELRNFFDSFLYFFMASFGAFEIDIFDVYIDSERYILHKIGIYFVLSFVFLNVLILVNVVIAMMADTYSLMTAYKTGIYNHTVLRTAPAYKLDKRYGFLTLLPGPMSLFCFMLIPYYACLKDRARLERFNQRVYKMVYFMLFLMLGTFFVAINLMLVPFAYLKTCLHKIILARKGITSFADVFLYVLGGLPMGIIAQVPDFWAFIKSSWDVRRKKRTDETFVISQESFDIFYSLICKYELLEHIEGKRVRAFDLIAMVRKRLDIENQLMTAIYGTDLSTKKA
eukprot:CAMPEP_0185586748 /NCGR_PEP_ID=MMETSP0434-20130131/45905_1 /TAXON_ID=626734 ORGANISM="Favella taraikaensis, Strain Fe Narragansett Bay" /NCGR_SAMPLE_ID=MMETSP0434 /ASSEMBLY_ACC=CAM_ASM_000379 /LENGTH=292 /DNA_ID=CAMNT_0028208111 /DNA_START=412 /DNA_END=1290 /DNA_ORIENTATION=-